MGQPSEVSEKLDALVRRASDLHARVSSLYEQLAADPTPRSAEEHALRTLLDERETLAADIGNLVIAIVADNGNVTVGGEAPAPRARAAASDPVVIRRTPTERRAAQPEAAALVFKRDPNAERQRLALVELIDMLGVPVLVDNARKFESEVKKLHTAVGRMDAWVGQPAPAQQALLGLSSSKARHIQDECGVPFPFFLRAPLQTVFSNMTRYSKEKQPGWVPGLSRRHEPRNGTWHGDAQFWWDRLQEMIDLGEYPENDDDEEYEDDEEDGDDQTSDEEEAETKEAETA